MGPKNGFFPSFFQRLTGLAGASADGLKTGLQTLAKIASKIASGTEHHGVRDPSRQQHVHLPAGKRLPALWLT